jgi:hypothetical protein
MRFVSIQLEMCCIDSPVKWCNPNSALFPTVYFMGTGQKWYTIGNRVPFGTEAMEQWNSFLLVILILWRERVTWGVCDDGDWRFYPVTVFYSFLLSQGTIVRHVIAWSQKSVTWKTWVLFRLGPVVITLYTITSDLFTSDILQKTHIWCEKIWCNWSKDQNWAACVNTA